LLHHFENLPNSTMNMANLMDIYYECSMTLSYLSRFYTSPPKLGRSVFNGIAVYLPREVSRYREQCSFLGTSDSEAIVLIAEFLCTV
jgi:hypothetical protein